MGYDTLDVEETDGRATVTVDRPEQVNTLSAAVFADLDRAFSDLGTDPPDVVTLRGAGGNFSAGVDLGMGPDLAAASPLDARDDYEAIHDAYRAVEGLDAPVIAALEGYVLGGAVELAASCDIRIAAADATLRMPESELGIPIDFGGAQKLPALIGESMAKYLTMTAKPVDADRAHGIGLVHEVAEPGEFEAAVTAMEDRLAGMPTYVHGLNKRMIHDARPPDWEEGMETAIHYAIAAWKEGETMDRVDEFLDR
jgi:enoyl-CoA hydratase/carnithine racemase